MKDIGNPGKEPPEDNSSRRREDWPRESEPRLHFPLETQRDIFPVADSRVTLTPHEPTRFPTLHGTVSLTSTAATLHPRLQVTKSTAPHGRLPLARNGVTQRELRAAVGPMGRAPGGDPRSIAAAGQSAHMMQAGPSGSGLDLTGCAGPRLLRPLPPADTRPREPSRPTQPRASRRRNITMQGEAVHAEEPPRVVRLEPVPPPQSPAAPSDIGRRPGRRQARHNRDSPAYTYVSADTNECVCFAAGDSISTNWSEYQERTRPQTAPRLPPFERSPLAPRPRLLPRRPQMEPRRLSSTVDQSTTLPPLSQNASMVCNISDQQQMRELQQATSVPHSTACDHEPPRMILSALRETQQQQQKQQQASVSLHGRGSNVAASSRTQRDPGYEQDVHRVIAEHAVPLETLQSDARERRRTCRPPHRRRRRLTLALPMARTFRLRTRKPMSTHRVVLG
ncbi:uncharacterized protein LOC121715837 [Alosa sapidissima]|uniref:uncharacterized protein LOC121715837 n=1 Tax=Alosa sapidissima TaxID=34773 RepID=UPI001C085B71|nr:uncharacterized protein LOC121715837 [Alosa sapidissima]XP_041957758.1 uncharacterized protein LOC121715837 [Alosa sapidissima]XP_041957759.1 uncharacterized protein LOC121715837 [Alosa sapidissima]XP_041957760.1 uncharacterized protein LOC121715837 [Alosa sapidissima]XP_041957761.1 uncharacterized protein LOC121715837 [Alosa sapidissima]XP_041957762.1 uncharacterized protein LOC121715837 [Alosa sapidissima]